MTIASLKIALNNAIKPDAEIYGLFMERLKSDIGEIADTLNIAYKAIDPRVGVSADYSLFNHIAIHYYRENSTDDDYSWFIEMDRVQQKFLFQDSGDELKTDFPLTETGFQSLVCHVAGVLNQFIPADVRIAYFLESSRRQGQQMLNFVVE